MPLADISFGEILLVALEIFFFVVWIWILITILSDLFRDHETSGWAKAAWVLALIVLPLLASLAYLIVRGRGMAERSIAQQRAARAEFDSYVRTTAASSGTGPVDDLTRLADLRSSGAITDEEFETIKARVVEGAAPASS